MSCQEHREVGEGCKERLKRKGGRKAIRKAKVRKLELLNAICKSIAVAREFPGNRICSSQVRRNIVFSGDLCCSGISFPGVTGYVWMARLGGRFVQWQILTSFFPVKETARQPSVPLLVKGIFLLLDKVPALYLFPLSGFLFLSNDVFCTQGFTPSQGKP